MSANPENLLKESLQEEVYGGGTPGMVMPENNPKPEEEAVAEKEEMEEDGPPVPRSLEETGLELLIVEELILKTLLAKGALTGRELSDSVCLHFSIVEKIMADLKARLFVAHKDNAGMGDFVYILSDLGKETALKSREVSAYVGPAPVPYEDYLYSIELQSIRNETPTEETLKEIFADMVFDESFFDTLGPAVNSGRGLFLYGEPGNGKTTIAEKLSQSFGQNIFIPKALWVEGQIVQLYDPQNHEPVPVDKSLIAEFDQRWIKIKRPAVMVGGELTMEALEIKYNPILRVSEAPLQMKANCGIFLIDDFGRQRMSHADLLNRWIVPLEKRVDFLTLPNGQKIEVPFDELIIFSTNLDPSDLVDDAFLRRIPYKIHVKDPSEQQYKGIFKILCDRKKIEFNEEMYQYLLNTYYTGQRPFRGCQPRDLLDQILNAAAYKKVPPEMTKENLDMACKNYFAAMSNIGDD